MAEENTGFIRLIKNYDVFMSIGILGILVIMILPLPSFLLDIFLTMSITIAVIIILVSIYIQNPLEFSTFPSVLLIVTLFRLSLNVATTRKILLEGAEGINAAGVVIQAFGQFVVGGNFAVGFIIFLILVIINFVVITKGSGRVAEVAARFTLDAMPGKQMSIDADLNAGMIDEQQARIKRDNIQRQADFYGAMDGATKFVRGDAIAGLIITAINIIAGLVIGVAQHGMTILEATQRFTILTVGDGLVAQIPALVISTSAGIVITRAGESADLSGQLAVQLFQNSKVLGVTGGVLVFFALIPGLPKIPFIFLALVLIGISYFTKESVKEQEQLQAEEEKEGIPEEEDVANLLDLDIMELEVGFNLISLIDTAQGGTLLGKIKSIRKQIALDMGFIVPPIRIRDNLQVEQNQYVIIIKGTKVVTGEVIPDKFLVMNPDGNLDKIEGISTKEPTFGLEGKWIDEDQKEKAEMEGYTIVEPSTVIVTHLAEIIKNNAHELIGRQEIQELLDKLKEKTPKLVEDVVPGIIDLSTLHFVLQSLLKERVSIRNLRTILEVLASYGLRIKKVDELTEKVRIALKRQITESLSAADGRLYIFTLMSKIEQYIAQNTQETDEGKEIVIDPSVAQKILSAILNKVDEITAKGLMPVIVVSPPIRIAFRRFVEKFIPNIYVISHNEISDNAMIESMGVIEIEI